MRLTHGSPQSPTSLGQYGLACPLCDSPIYNSEPCGHCLAPWEVIRSIAARGASTRFIGVLGPSNVGKTVYLGMLLDLLSRGSGGLHGVARGAFTTELHRGTITALERQRFPGKTPSEPDRWQWAHCQVESVKGGRGCDIITPDVAGEVVAAELASPGTYPTVRALIGRCAGLVVLVDVAQVIADGRSQELFAMQLVTYLDGLRPARRGGKLDVPVALVFTKADLCDDGPVGDADADAFARSNAPGLWRLCQARLSRHQFFTSAVAGSVATLVDRDGSERLVPLRIEPRGVVEPLAWLLERIR